MTGSLQRCYQSKTYAELIAVGDAGKEGCLARAAQAEPHPRTVTELSSICNLFVAVWFYRDAKRAADGQASARARPKGDS